MVGKVNHLRDRRGRPGARRTRAAGSVRPGGRYSTVTLFARLRGLSTSRFRATAA